MKVFLPSPLYSYTNEKRSIDASGTTLAELLHDMEAKYPGIRFRVIDEQGNIRQHIKIFVNKQLVRKLDVHLNVEDEIIFIAALSGG
ncbi:MAG: Sulfur carrier protein CysO [Pseudomonadota bacterium]|jgi:sulfur-carrier protein